MVKVGFAGIALLLESDLAPAGSDIAEMSSATAATPASFHLDFIFRLLLGRCLSLVELRPNVAPKAHEV